MRINIITKNNGVGLYQDYLILREILETKHEINFIDFEKPVLKKADLSIHLEHARPNLLGTSPYNIFVPNPEWFNGAWIRNLPRFQQVWCKTHETEKIFKRYNCPTIYTSFTSKDFYDSDIIKQKVFFHNRGKSSHKGTLYLIQAYKDLLGKLIINSAVPLGAKKGMIVNTKRLSEEDLKTVMNMCMFHVCPSEAEGFGHYINEARSCGAIVITTDAPPMNEFVTDDYGIRVPFERMGKHGLSTTYIVNPIKLAYAMDELRNKSDKDLQLMSDMSRQAYLDNDSFFKTKIKELLDV